MRGTKRRSLTVAGSEAVVATDLDGTLKLKGAPLSQSVVEELARLRSVGAGLILVTGRCEAETVGILDPCVFDAEVLENGAIVRIGNRKEVLADDSWMTRRREIASTLPSQCEEVILTFLIEDAEKAEGYARKLGGRLEMNKDRVMVLPPGVDKGSGLKWTIAELGWAGKILICVGDGENDLSMLLVGDIRLAVANAVQKLKDAADMVARKEDGEGWVSMTRELFPVPPADSRGRPESRF